MNDCKTSTGDTESAPIPYCSLNSLVSDNLEPYFFSTFCQSICAYTSPDPSYPVDSKLTYLSRSIVFLARMIINPAKNIITAATQIRIIISFVLRFPLFFFFWVFSFVSGFSAVSGVSAASAATSVSSFASSCPVTGFPHAAQNFASSAFSVPQYWHFISTPSYRLTSRCLCIVIILHLFFY